MPAPKKVWSYDGHASQFPSVLTNGSVHAGRRCTECHGGVEYASTREAAHAGLVAIPGANTCAGCHRGQVDAAAQSLHADSGGFYPVLRRRGVDLAAGSVTLGRFQKQCAKCHTAAANQQSACGHCHLSVPNTAGGGLLAGHAFQRRPSMDSNCAACHGSRVKDEYYAQNNPLLTRNATRYPAGSPFIGATLQPDVHKSAGKDCTFCHAGSEMHGVGAPPDGDRYQVTGTTRCTSCHVPSPAIALHSARHLASMDCRVCHAQPYKNCFGCHTDVSARTGEGFFLINEAAQTWTTTKDAAGADVKVPDSLMTFRVGKNPRSDRAEKYVVLRHVPVDKDVFAYTGVNALARLVPGMTLSSTWKYATPHTILRKTAIQSSCGNCHGTDYAKYWLTDPVADALGWVGPSYAADETAANAGVTQPVLLPMTP